MYVVPFSRKGLEMSTVHDQHYTAAFVGSTYFAGACSSFFAKWQPNLLFALPNCYDIYMYNIEVIRMMYIHPRFVSCITEKKGKSK